MMYRPTLVCINGPLLGVIEMRHASILRIERMRQRPTLPIEIESITMDTRREPDVDISLALGVNLSECEGSNIGPKLEGGSDVAFYVVFSQITCVLRNAIRQRVFGPF